MCIQIECNTTQVLFIELFLADADRRIIIKGTTEQIASAFTRIEEIIREVNELEKRERITSSTPRKLRSVKTERAQSPPNLATGQLAPGTI